MKPLIAALLFCITGVMASAQVRSGAFSLTPIPIPDAFATHQIYVDNISGATGPSDPLDYNVSSWTCSPGIPYSTLTYESMMVNRYDAWWSLVPEGAVLTSATYPDFNSLQPIVIPNFQTFYLGVRFTVSRPLNGPSEPFVDVDCAYGWVALRSLGGNLELVSSALAPGASGIVVGTLTAVPEPSALSLALLGLAFLVRGSGRSNRE